MKRLIRAGCCLLVPMALGAAACADEGPEGRSVADTSAYTLFNPTPADQLRELDFDGPGTTESPYTVDAGYFQVEMALVSYTCDRNSFGSDTDRLEAWAMTHFTVKLGLLKRLDAQLVLEPYTIVYARSGADRVTRRRGRSDSAAGSRAPGRFLLRADIEIRRGAGR